MKKLFNLIRLLSFVIISSFIVSCTNFNEDTEKNGNSDAFAIKIHSKDESINFSRTILPESVNLSDLTFYIAYRTLPLNAESILKIEAIETFSNNNNSTGVLYKNFAPGAYQIFLFGFTSENLTNAASQGYDTSSLGLDQLEKFAGFQGNSTIDTRSFYSIDIYLTTNFSSKAASGFLTLDIRNSADWLVPADYSVTAALYKENSQGELTLAHPADREIELYTRKSYDASFGTKVFSNKLAVPQGIYTFVINYKKYTTSTTIPDVTYTYNEKVIIYNNRTSIKHIDLQEIINKKPEAPTCFIAGYKKPDSEIAGYYQVQFAWYDNSYTERSYKLELLNVSDNTDITMPVSDSEFEPYVTNYGTKNNYVYTAGNSSSYFIKGTLGQNSTSVTFYVPLGKRYIARLCAVNDGGDSAWAYLNKTAGLTYTNPADSTQKATLESDFEVFPSDVETINLYQINYYYQNGIATAKKNNTLTELPVTTFYRSQRTDTSKLEILNPDGITTNSYFTQSKSQISDATFALHNQSAFWDHWNTQHSDGITYPHTATYIPAVSYIEGVKYYISETGTEPAVQPTSDNFDQGTYFVRKVTVEPYKGYENLSLFAVYDKPITENYDEFKFKPEYVTVAFLKNGGFVSQINENETYTDTDADGKKTLADSTSAGYIEISKKYVTGIYLLVNSPIYNDSTLEIRRNLDSANLDYEIVSKDYYNLDLSQPQWIPGLYNIIFTGTATSNGLKFMYQLQLRITN